MDWLLIFVLVSGDGTMNGTGTMPMPDKVTCWQELRATLDRHHEHYGPGTFVAGECINIRNIVEGRKP